MKGVILGGGKGTRLYPLTYVTNKHLLPIYDRPMVFYPIRTLVEAGVTEILLVVGGPYAGDYLRVLKNGKEFGIKHLEYAYQENEGGISQAISLAEDFAGGDAITVILGDNTTDADISEPVHSFEEGAMMFLKQVNDPQRFGVAVFDDNDSTKIIKVEEKPKEPKTNFASTGLYIFDNTCFERIRNLQPSSRGELEVTDLQNSYISEGKMRWTELKGFWSDAGTFESLYRSSKYWAEKAQK
ncbi:MAG: sugar phosphate nucleotidyltransferase [Patescibacteria group bacterium]|jgi:glucose-1-phosphate thymidylyltransferase